MGRPAEPSDGEKPTERSLDALLDEMHEAYVAFDPDWRITSINRSAATFLQQFADVSREGLGGRILWEVFPKLAQLPMGQEFHRAAAGGRMREFEVFLPISKRWLAFRASPSSRGLSILFRDITEQKSATEALRASEAWLRSIYENSLDAIFLTAPTGEILRANPAACRMVGRSEAEIRALGRAGLVDSADVRADLLVEERARTGRAAGELTFLRADGSRFPVAIQSAVFTDAEGQWRAIVTAHSLSEKQERERLEAQLARADRMAALGTLASGMAHEINNPLSYVAANLELVAEELRVIAGDAGAGRLNELCAMLDDARVGAERIRKIVRGLKTFARNDAPELAPVDLGAVLDVAADMASIEIRHHARLVKEYGPTPQVEADEAKLGQVFINLLINAAQAIPAGNAQENEIRIKTFTDDAGSAVVEVSDTGAGIPDHLLARIFDPFFTTKAVGVGTGLGLSISHETIVGFGGRIEVESAAGRGSIFRVRLPALVTVSEAPPPLVVGAAAPSPGGLILVIDDEAAVGALLQRGLGKEHRTSIATSGQEALRRLAEGERFDVILCDVMMPDLTGPELHGRIRSLAPDQAARMVFMTGGAFTPAAQSFLDEIGNPIVDKPFNIQAVRALVRAMIAGT